MARLLPAVVSSASRQFVAAHCPMLCPMLCCCLLAPVQVVDAPNLPESEASYAISTDGIVDYKD
jgi:hypothetical protein